MKNSSPSPLPAICLSLTVALVCVIAYQWITGGNRNLWIINSMTVVFLLNTWAMNAHRPTPLFSLKTDGSKNPNIMRLSLVLLIPIASGFLLPTRSDNLPFMDFSVKDILEGRVDPAELKRQSTLLNERIYQHFLDKYAGEISEEERERFIKGRIKNGVSSILLIAPLLKTENLKLKEDLLIALDGVIAPTYTERYRPEMSVEETQTLIAEIEGWRSRRQKEASLLRQKEYRAEVERRVREENPEIYRELEEINQRWRESFRENYERGESPETRQKFVRNLISDGTGSFDTIENLIKVDNRDLREDLLLALDGIIAPTYSQKYSPELTDATVEMLIREISQFD